MKKDSKAGKNSSDNLPEKGKPVLKSKTENKAKEDKPAALTPVNRPPVFKKFY